MTESDKKYLKDLLSRDPRLTVEKLKDHLVSAPKKLEQITEIEAQQVELSAQVKEGKISQGETENKQSELREAILHLIEEAAIDADDTYTHLIGSPKYQWVLVEVIGVIVLFLGGAVALAINQLFIPAAILVVTLVVLVVVFAKPVGIYFKSQQAIRTRAKNYYANLENSPNKTKVLIEGDSWFNDPNVQDVADYLAADFNVYSFAENGSKIRGILKDKDFRRLVNLEKPQVVILNAGGKELFERYSHEIVKRAFDGDEFFTPYYTALMRDITNLYEGAIEDLLSKTERIIVAGYDYMIHKEGAFHKLLTKRGFNDPNLAIKRLIDDLNTQLNALADKHDNVFYIDLRNTIDSPEYWQDELHPNDKGFEKIAAIYKAKIQEVAVVEM